MNQTIHDAFAIIAKKMLIVA